MFCLQTVDSQKQKLEESEQLLNQRRSVLLDNLKFVANMCFNSICVIYLLIYFITRDLIAKYRSSVEGLIKSEP